MPPPRTRRWFRQLLRADINRNRGSWMRASKEKERATLAAAPVAAASRAPGVPGSLKGDTFASDSVKSARMLGREGIGTHLKSASGSTPSRSRASELTAAPLTAASEPPSGTAGLSSAAGSSISW